MKHKPSKCTKKVITVKHVNKKRLLKTFGLLLALILIVALGLFLIQQYNSKYPTEGIAGKAYSDLTAEQKQGYWACYKEKGCGALLGEAQQSKNYAAYRSCSKDCHAQALAQKQEDFYCIDSDGIDYTNKGKVTSYFYPNGKEDYCLDINGKNYLFEGKCVNNKAKFVQKGCGEMGNYGCEEGVCKVICPKGVLNDGSCSECNNFWDCLSFGEGYTCDYGKCVAIKTISTCTDSDDGQDFFVQGKTHFEDKFGSNLTKYDSCKNNLLEELFCDDSNQLSGNAVQCENGCVNGKCLTDEEKPLSCLEVVSGHNNVNENRINLIFVGQGYSNVVDFKMIVDKLVDYDDVGFSFDPLKYYTSDSINRTYGILAVEPYKSNKDKFNFWYINDTYPGFTDVINPTLLTNSEKLCPVSDYIKTSVINSLIGKGGSAGENGIVVSVQQKKNFSLLRGPTLLTHELGHFIGDLPDEIYEGLESYSKKPSCAKTIDEAKEWWGNMIGFGCGNENSIDCGEDCFEEGTCELLGYETEVQNYVTSHPDCFNSGMIVPACAVIATRAAPKPKGEWVEVEPGLFENTFYSMEQIAFKATSKEGCITGIDNCVYFEAGKYFCVDKKTKIEGDCLKLGNKNYEYTFEQGCKFRPDLSSIMTEGISLKYGPVSEKYICKKLKEKLGSVGGICTTKYGIS